MHHSKFALFFYYTLLEVELGFPGGSAGKESACNARDLGSIPGLGRSLGGGHGTTLQYSCLENPHGQRSLAGCSPWGGKELDTTERLSTTHTEVELSKHSWNSSSTLPTSFQQLYFSVYSFLLRCSRALRHQYWVLGVSCVFSLSLMKEKTHLFYSFNFTNPLRQFFKYTFAIFSADFVICLFFLLIYILGSL